MGSLTQDAARLRSEIDAAQRGRVVLKKDIKRSTAAMRHEVAAMKQRLDTVHTEAARRARARRRAFMASLRSEVSHVKAQLRKTHAERANASRATRSDFASSLARDVAALLRATAQDLTGARRAFFGTTSHRSRSSTAGSEDIYGADHAQGDRSRWPERARKSLSRSEDERAEARPRRKSA
jgi:hypothetical protein